MAAFFKPPPAPHLHRTCTAPAPHRTAPYLHGTGRRQPGCSPDLSRFAQPPAARDAVWLNEIVMGHGSA